METLKASDHVNDGKFHLLLAATGSVATIKIPNIAKALSKYPNISIRILLSESAANFLQGQADEQPTLYKINRIKNVDGIYRDSDEWKKPWVRGDSILHIELRRWADLMVIAPLSANSLAKLAMGMSDNLVTSVARAWDTTGLIDSARPGIDIPGAETATLRQSGVSLPIFKKKIIIAPAMNTAMWEHPVTTEHLDKLSRTWAWQNGGWFEVLKPIQKELACGDTGSGAMTDWKEIVRAIAQYFELDPNMEVETSTVRGSVMSGVSGMTEPSEASGVSGPSGVSSVTSTSPASPWSKISAMNLNGLGSS